MSRARFDTQQTAAAYETQGSGCLSGFLLPPLVVILVGSLLALGVRSLPTLDTIPTTSLTEQSDTLQPSDHQTIELSNYPTNRLSPVFTPEVQFWGPAISRWAAASGLDPNLVAVIMQIESCGDPSARSNAGAMGLFQVMPYHFLASDDPYSPDTNAARGLDYLKRSLAAANNDVRLALAGYNGGIGVISRSKWNWPAETIHYVYWGGGIYQDAISGAAQSGRLNEWLTASGSGLCHRAGQKLGILN